MLERLEACGGSLAVNFVRGSSEVGLPRMLKWPLVKLLVLSKCRQCPPSLSHRH